MNSKNNHADDAKDKLVVSTNGGRRGQLLFLKTPLETRTRNPVVDCFITLVPKHQAYNTHAFIKKNLPYEGDLDLKHLRYITRYEELPESVRTVISTSRGLTLTTSNDDLSDSRVLIVAPINSISQQSVVESLSTIHAAVPICSIPLPKLAPTSQDQAKLLTSEYWPSVYQKTNTFGPHFKTVLEAEDDIQEDVEKWMDLAVKVAYEANTSGAGENIGVVIVERKEGVSRLVAVAGDARWQEWPHNSLGNATAHAVLRGIAMVSQGLKLHHEEGKEVKHTSAPEKPFIFRDQPLGQLEQEHYHPSKSGDGYLCQNLEIYCTHEPCVMCSMAIVHSRFGKIVFKQRMPRTGGICSDGELGHGLFWRKELNWQMLAWQWSTGDNNTQDDGTVKLHA